MPKLVDQDAAQLAATLVSISGPIRSFVEDEEFMNAVTNSVKRNVNTKLHAAMLFFSDITPYLLGDKHLADTIAILAAIEGESPRKMMKKNGAEVLADAIEAWNSQLKGFFLRLGITA